MKNTRFVSASLTMLAMAALSACGGGGSDSTPTTPTEPPKVEVPPSTIVTQVPPATYGANSYEKLIYDEVNTERAKCGLGLLEQSPQLDLSATDSAFYVITNHSYSHVQVPGTPGFTGINPDDRARYRGYKKGAGEVLTGVGGSTIFNLHPEMTHSAWEFYSAVYHGLSVLGGYQHIGIGVGTEAMTDGIGASVIYHLGNDGFQGPAGDQVLTYPCDGVTLHFSKIGGETPNPFADRNLATNPVGHPLYVFARPGSTLENVVYELTDETGKSYPMIVRTASNDPNPLYMPNYVAVGFADGALAKGKKFTAKVSGTIVAAGNILSTNRPRYPFSKTYTFSTASNAY